MHVCVCVCVGAQSACTEFWLCHSDCFPAELYIALVLTTRKLDTASIVMAIAIALQYGSLIFRLTILIMKC